MFLLIARRSRSFFGPPFMQNQEIRVYFCNPVSHNCEESRPADVLGMFGRPVFL